MSSGNDDYWSGSQQPDPNYNAPAPDRGFVPNPQQSQMNLPPYQQQPAANPGYYPENPQPDASYGYPPEQPQPGAAYGYPPDQPQSGFSPNQGFYPDNQPATFQPQADGVYPPLVEHPSANGVLVLGLLGTFLFPPLGIIAVVMGNKARREIREYPDTYMPSATLNVGWVFGIIGTIFTVILVMVLLLMVIALIIAAGSI